MNWLAHLHLSESSARFRIGNLLPDLVPARELAGLAEEFQRGAKCHRRIDAFTDSHPTFRKSISRLSPRFRRFGGVIVDVLYDHFLTANWHWHARTPLRCCVDEFYASFDVHRDEIPSGIWPVLECMREQDWLGSYGELAGVRVALGRIGRRLRRPLDLGDCKSELEQDYAGFQADFDEFFPRLVAHVGANGIHS